MCAEWGHAGASPDVHHFLLRGLDVKVTVRSDGGDGVARSEIKHVSGAGSRRTVLTRRRRSNANVQAEDGFGLRIAGQRIVVAPAGRGIAGDQVEHMPRLPNLGVRLRDVKVTEANTIVGRDIELQIVARREIHSVR